jgi:hypothetical protein
MVLQKTSEMDIALAPIYDKSIREENQNYEKIRYKPNARILRPLHKFERRRGVTPGF